MGFLVIKFMITVETKEKNYNLFVKKLESIGIDTSKFSTIEDKLKNASFALNNENGLAYDGSLINTVLRVLTPYAVGINNLLPNEIKVNQDKLVKVCLLHQISKCQMFIPNDSEWHVKHGIVYKYADYPYALKMGMRSIVLLQELGIALDGEEMEAITILDRQDDDNQVKFFSSPLATIVRQANELTYTTKRLIKD